jgi:hypothetical protein
MFFRDWVSTGGFSLLGEKNLGGNPPPPPAVRFQKKKMITNTLINSMQQEYMPTFGSYRIYLQGHSGVFTTNACTNKVSARFPDKLC